eukprot:6178528-Pleurochrysis_carterae.AAC.2
MAPEGHRRMHLPCACACALRICVSSVAVEDAERESGDRTHQTAVHAAQMRPIASPRRRCTEA